jgi:hypothetical protein
VGAWGSALEQVPTRGWGRAARGSRQEGVEVKGCCWARVGGGLLLGSHSTRWAD